MRAIVCLAVPAAAWLAAASAAAPAASAAPRGLPKDVRAVVSQFEAACRKANGLGLRMGKDAVRRLDLTGDGRPDTIVDLTHAECRLLPSLFCGTGGCPLVILVAVPGRGHVKVFQNRVIAYRIERAAGPARIVFHLHGTYCDGAGADPCFKTQTITATPFAYDNR